MRAGRGAAAIYSTRRRASKPERPAGAMPLFIARHYLTRRDHSEKERRPERIRRSPRAMISFDSRFAESPNARACNDRLNIRALENGNPECDSARFAKTSSTSTTSRDDPRARRILLRVYRKDGSSRDPLGV